DRVKNLTKFNKRNKPIIIKLKELKAFRNKEDTDTKGIVSSGTRIIKPLPEKVTLFTIIKSIGSSRNKPLENLTIGNFTVKEKYNEFSGKAKILSLKPLSSPLQAVLVLDNSATIAPVKDQVSDAVKSFLGVLKNLEIPSKSKIAILPISLEEGDKVGNYLSDESNEDPEWFSFDNAHLIELDSLIKDTMKVNKLGTKTPLWDGIESALKKLNYINNDEYYKFILCITDGINDGGNIKKYSLIENLLQSKYSEIPIFTIGYRGSQGLNAEELVRLSQLSGAGREGIGSFMDVKAQDLVEVYDQIALSIDKSYELSWRPTGAGIGVPVSVSIEIEYEGMAQEPFRTTIDKEYTLQPDSSPIEEVQ
ncbi:MAG: VWA domain-containing protein, partial [Cyanobacteria bacterium P01_F01_bin.143]